ncbi:MAG: hypothetical protein K8J31_25565 [Anaerolineae bacterium]|nr:hypothetical protein [Anaerolineae bacterium]
MFTRFQTTIITLISLAAMIFVPLAGATAPAQDSDPEDTPAIVIEGPVQALNVNILTIADIHITVEASDPLLTTLHVGDVVQVQGDIDDTTNVLVVRARQVVVTGNNIVTPLIAITGPVQAVNVNIVTIFNIPVQFNPSDLILAQLHVGDVLSVGGNLVSSGGGILIIPVQAVIVVNVEIPDPEATPESTPDPEATPEITPEPNPGSGNVPVTIVVEGPVEAINVNVITIFNIQIEVEPTAPILTQIHIGDHIRVEGNPRTVGNTIIIVAVNVTIVNVIVVDHNPNVIIVNPGLPNGCKISKNGKIKCSKKKKKS